MSISAEELPAESLRAAVLKALYKQIGDDITSGKKPIKALMDALRINTLCAELPDGTEVAEIRRAGGNTSATVTDEDKFLRWVVAHRPGEVVQAVRESYQKHLLEAITKAGTAAVDKRGRPIDPESGEPVEGVGFTTGTAYLTVNFEPGGEDAIKEAWQSGRLSLDSMLALPAPEATP
jgi:hypothetical protein